MLIFQLMNYFLFLLAFAETSVALKTIRMVRPAAAAFASTTTSATKPEDQRSEGTLMNGLPVSGLQTPVETRINAMECDRRWFPFFQKKRAADSTANSPTTAKTGRFYRIRNWKIPGTHIRLLPNLIWVTCKWMSGLQPHEIVAITTFWEYEQRFLDWLEEHKDAQVESRLLMTLLRLRKRLPRVFTFFLKVALDTIFEDVFLPVDKQGQLQYASMGRGLLTVLPLAVRAAGSYITRPHPG